MQTCFESLTLSNMFLALTKALPMNDGVLSSITFYSFTCFIRVCCIKFIPSGYYGYWLLSTGVCLMAFGRNGCTRIPVRNCIWIVSLLSKYFHFLPTKYICNSSIALSQCYTLYRNESNK